jgi:hypothetical protein
MIVFLNWRAMDECDPGWLGYLYIGRGIGLRRTGRAEAGVAGRYRKADRLTIRDRVLLGLEQAGAIG